MAAKRTAPRATKRSPKLYWVTTPDHDEDWFVVALSAASARRFHESQEGYGPGEAAAELVCALPARLCDAETGWPSDDDLAACGGEIVSAPKAPRVVRINGRLFGAGDLVGNVMARTRPARRH